MRYVIISSHNKYVDAKAVFKNYNGDNSSCFGACIASIEIRHYNIIKNLKLARFIIKLWKMKQPIYFNRENFTLSIKEYK